MLYITYLITFTKTFVLSGEQEATWLACSVNICDMDMNTRIKPLRILLSLILYKTFLGKS